MSEDVLFHISKNTKQAMDRAIQIGLIEDQEEFIREAISEKLEKIGIKLGDE